jgi:hypothetical protein
MLTEERKAILKEKYSKWYLVSREQGIGLADALDLASEDGAYVYERLAKSTSVTLDHNERMLSALKACAERLARERGCNCTSSSGCVIAGILQNANDLIAEVEAYNAAEVAITEKYAAPTTPDERSEG